MADFRTYEEVIDFIILRKNRDENKAQILTVWKYMTLSKDISVNPTQSEKPDLRTFVSNLISLHNQLVSPDHTDYSFRDKLLTAVHIQFIQTTLRDHMPRTYHPVINKISNQFRGKQN